MSNFDRQYMAQGGRCFWHGALVPIELMTRDHLVTRAAQRVGRHGEYVLACRECNLARAGLTIGSLRFERWLRRVLRGDVRTFTRREHRTFNRTDCFVHNPT